MSGFLLDTHVMLWLAFDRRRIAEEVRDRLAEPADDLYISSVSAIEIALKSGLGKLALPAPFQLDLRTAFAGLVGGMSAKLLDLDLGSVGRLQRLPLHHRDPFDRLLLSQAVENDLVLVSHDRAFAAYSEVEVIWA